jgi:hypothetical protein
MSVVGKLLQKAEWIERRISECIDLAGECHGEEVPQIQILLGEMKAEIAQTIDALRGELSESELATANRRLIQLATQAESIHGNLQMVQAMQASRRPV